MAHYKVNLAYDGTDFEGFQRQGNARTVQLVVEDTLRCLNWQGQTILAAGRTDSGVHAAGQVVTFELDWAHSTEQLGRAMNANLPRDVSVKRVEIVAEDFHPRYSARARTYQYHIYCEPARHPLFDRFAWKVWPPVEFIKLHHAASLLIGVHDFAAFGTPPKSGGRTDRTVFKAGWEPQAEGLLFEVTANAFLYHMVRRMVYLQVLTGQDRLGLDDLEKAITGAQPQIPGLAPPNGLVLWKVWYVDWQGN